MGRFGHFTFAQLALRRTSYRFGEVARAASGELKVRPGIICEPGQLSPPSDFAEGCVVRDVAASALGLLTCPAVGQHQNPVTVIFGCELRVSRENRATVLVRGAHVRSPE